MFFQTQARVSNALYSILLPPSWAMGCNVGGIPWSVEHDDWIFSALIKGKLKITVKYVLTLQWIAYWPYG